MSSSGDAKGRTSQDRFSLRQSHFAPQKIGFGLSWKRFPIVMKPKRERFVTELGPPLVTVPRAPIARGRPAMGFMGLGPGTSGVGLAWAFYVHDTVEDVGGPESIFAPPHLII